MANFDTAVALVLRHEGGLVDDPRDPGGLTNFGISARAHPDIAIRNLTVEDAKAIYLRDYWTPLGADGLSDQRLANSALDFAVNAGLSAADALLRKNFQVDSFTVARIRYYAGRKNFPRFAVSWVKRALDY